MVQGKRRPGQGFYASVASHIIASLYYRITSSHSVTSLLYPSIAPSRRHSHLIFTSITLIHHPEKLAFEAYIRNSHFHHRLRGMLQINYSRLIDLASVTQPQMPNIKSTSWHCAASSKDLSLPAKGCFKILQYKNLRNNLKITEAWPQIFMSLGLI